MYHKTKPALKSPNMAAVIASRLRTTSVHMFHSLLRKGDLLEHRSKKGRYILAVEHHSSLEHNHIAWHKSLS